MRRTVVCLVLLAACAKPAPKPAATAIDWIEDDYPRAVALARAEKKPIFLDAWAPWCHTCLSMRSYVFKDPGLVPLADRFVWLSIDTEKASNAAATARFTAPALPTFFIVDPEGEVERGRWIGSGSLAQMRTFLTDGERAVQLAHAGQLAPDDPLALVLAGDVASQAKKHDEAAALYAKALEKAAKDWPRRTYTMFARIMALDGKPSDCVDYGLSALPDMGLNGDAAGFAISAVGCADELPVEDPRVEKMRRLAAERMAVIADDMKIPLSFDDRGDIQRYLWDTLEKLGDKAGARAMAEKRRELLDGAAASAPDPVAASTYDWARAETDLYLDRGDEAIKLLEKSEKALPDDYNPPHRLARVYFNLGKTDEALTAIARALPKAYGPRKAGILSLKADILEKAGRVDEARSAVQEEIALYQGLPEGQKKPGGEAAARKRLATLGAQASGPR